MTADIATERRALALFRRLLDTAADGTPWDVVLADEPADVVAAVRRLRERHASATRRIEGAVAEFAERTLPAQLGGFRLGRELGRGGMGVVVEGERDLGGLRQRAAIKLIAGGQFDAVRRARFLHEREVVARLQHPRIARLLDGGEGADGELWYAMELVEGDILTRHCDSRLLDTRQRVALLVELCEAIAHAHRHSILHRDIKPSNVLVDHEGHLTLIDFGIAKSLDTSEDALTRERAPMTPRYAAPEQLRGERPTTSSDIWQLGALAYELLAGVPAREAEHGDIVAPSRQPQLAGPTSAGLRRALSGDLDAIVMRALREEPEQRYPSASQLATDLRDWLQGRPVAARRNERGYLARQFLRRHRWAAGFAALALIAIVAGSAASLMLAREARRQATEATNTAELLAEMFVSSRSAPNLSSMSLRDFFANATEIALSDPRLPPLQRTDLLYDLSSRAKDLRDFDLAERAARGMLASAPAVSGPASLQVAVGHDFVAGAVLLARGRAGLADAEMHLAKAEALYRQLDLLQNPEYTTTHLREVIRVQQLRGDSAAQLREARRAIAAMGHLPPDLVLNMRPLVVTALLADGQPDAAAEEAVAILRDAEAAIPERPRLANMRDWLRSIACHAEAHRDAAAAIAQCSTLLADLGPEPSTRIAARALLGLGLAHGASGDTAAAIAALQRGAAILQALEGDDLRSPERQALHEALGRQLLRAGDAQAAVERLVPLAAHLDDYLGPQHPVSLRVRLDLAEGKAALGRSADADRLLAAIEPAALPAALRARHARLRGTAP